MKVGMTLQLTSFANKPDLQTYQEELSIGDMAEGLGFDSIWTLDHHFTGYVMSPDPVALLMYVAGRTKRVQLGTAVIVLPWHDPVEVAEKIALLDLVSGGRTIYGFGRGAASIEYAGFRIPMEESRDRFVESLLIIRKGLTQESFSFEGKYYKVPEIQIRPRAISHPENRFYASSVSPESAEIMAKLGLGVLIIAQRSWEDKAVEFYRSLHAAGTADQVLEKIRYIHHTVPLEHMVSTFAFGGLPYPKLERSFKLFAEKILPVLQNDPAFKLPKEQAHYAEVR